MGFTNRRFDRVNGPIVCGHRGAPTSAPENTIAGFRTAQQQGATWIEFDVRPTADSVLVVHHDPVTADGHRVASLTAAELHAVAPAIPTLAQVIDAVPELGLDIELKADDIDLPLARFAELVVEQIRTHASGRSDVMVTSFRAAVLREVRSRGEDIATGFLFHNIEPAVAIDRAIDEGHIAIAPWIPLVDQALVDAARSADLAIATWTVNEPEDIRRASDLGVDMIIGDSPETILRHL